jgi:hypothetical protein
MPLTLYLFFQYFLQQFQRTLLVRIVSAKFAPESAGQDCLFHVVDLIDDIAKFFGFLLVFQEVVEDADDFFLFCQTQGRWLCLGKDLSKG